MPAKTNARDSIESLLATSTSPGSYSCGSELSCPIPTVKIIKSNERGDATGFLQRCCRNICGQECASLSFPLDAKGIQDIKDNAERAGVGLGEKTVVNLDVRTTWQIKPRYLHVSGAEQALDSALQMVSRELGTAADYNIQASLYKLLLYEEGCFFARHRDNERLDGMFATLVIELPSKYEGAELSVWSPLTPNEKMSYTFNGGASGSKRKTRSSSPGMHFAAFYADCYHEVSKLTSGHRVALVYHLTANVVPNPMTSHLPSPSPTPSQPADESIAIRLSKLMETYDREGDEEYPCTWEGYPSSEWEELGEWPGKPDKLVIVLSHHYTPANLTSIKALKGSDRSVAELIRAAAFCSPTESGADGVTSLARLAAKKVVEEGGQDYATTHSLAHEMIAEEFKGKDGSGPFFDAAISLATVDDPGEGWTTRSEHELFGTSTFRTTGPLVSLTGEGAVSIDLGPKLPRDIEADYHPSWFGEDWFDYFGPEDDNGWPDYDFEGGPIIYGIQKWARLPEEPGNHSLPLYSHELLFASEEAGIQFRKDNGEYVGKHVEGDNPKKLEFLGNGGALYPGRVYSRAVIIIWPKSHREFVQMQSKGGWEVYQQEKQRAENEKKQQAEDDHQ